MNVLDNPVVSMVFNNASFEKNAGTSLETIAKLKQALNFEGAVKGLENIGSSLKNTGIDAFYTGVYKVKDEFNALDIVAVRVIQNITDKVQGMVDSFASQAIVKPLKDGFDEYQLQMDSVQTIMASTGKSVGEVNGYLDELNEYADRTIYSFSDMTANIGKFTNAGVSLDKATAAIQGVSNVAAVSGAKTEEASRAMYNFAQALSAGSVKLIDWKSIENANMATVEFKEQLIQTAVAMGTLTKQGDDYVSTTTDANGKVSEAFNATKMFNDSLSSQWMTTDVLVQTLQQYSTDVRTLAEDEQKRYKEQLKSIGYNDQQIESIIELGKKAANSAKDVKTFSQLLDTLGESLGSGWTKTWQLIVGDLNEAKVLWTGVNDVVSGFIDKVSDSRNSILDTWHKSGYTFDQYGNLIKAFYDSEGKLVTKLPEDGKVFNQYGKEVEAVVNKETGELVPQLIENGEKVREEMGGRDFVIGGLQKAYETFAEIMKEFSASWNLNFLGIDNKTIDNISITGEKLIDLSRAFYDSMSAFKEAWAMRKETGEADGLLAQLREQFDFFTESLRNGYDGIKKVFSGLGTIFNSFFRSDFFNIGTLLNSAVTAFSAITGRIKDFGDAFAKHFGPDKDFKNLNGLVKFFNGIQSVLEAGFWVKFDFITNAFDALGNVVDHLISPFGTAAQLLGEVGLKLDKFGEAINTLFGDEDGSKFEAMFQGMAKEFNNFVDAVRENIDFSGFSKIFDSIIKVMTDDNINLFGAFEKIFDSLLNVFEGFTGVVSPVVAAFANIFGDSIVEGATFFTQVVDKFHEFTELLIPSADTMKGIQTLFEGIFSVIKAIGGVLGSSFLSLWDGLKSIFSAILPDGDGLATVLETIGNSLKGFAEAIKSLSTGDGDLGAFTDIFSKFGKTVGDFIKNVKDIGILQKAKDFLTDFLKSLKEHMFGSSEVGILEGFGEKFKTFVDNIKQALLGDNGFDVGDLLTGAGLFAALRTILNWIKDMFGKDKEGPFASIVNTIKDVGEAITDTFGMIQDRLKFDALKSIATSILMIAASLFIISTIDTPKLFTALGAIALMLKSMEQLMKSMNKLVNDENMKSGEIAAIAAAIASIGTSILSLAIAAKILGSMSIEELAKGLGGILVLMMGITKVAKEFSKFENDIAKGSAGLIAMAIAIDLLTIPVKVLGKMDWKQLALGLGATIALTFSLAKAASLIGKDFSFGDGAGLIAMAYAIKVLSGAVETMGSLSWEDLVKGLAGFAVILGGLVGSMILLDQYVAGDELVKFGAGLLLLSFGLNAVAKSVAVMGSLNLEQLVKGLGGLIVALGAMVAASAGIKKWASPEIVLSLAAFSASLILLAGALKIVASIPVPDLIKAAIGITATLGALVLISKVAAGSAAGIAALTGLAGAMALVGVAMLAFGAGLFLLSAAIAGGGSMLIAFLEQLIGLIPKVAISIAQGIIDLVATLASGAGKIADSILTVIQAVFTKIMTFVPMLIQFATVVLMMLGQSLITLIPIAVQILTTFIKSVLQGLQVVIPEIFALLQTILQNVLTFIQTNFPLIVQTLSVILQTILATIRENAPIIGETLLTLLQTILNIISTAVPQIVATVLSLLLNLLQQLAAFVPQMADAALQIIGGFLQAVGENIQQITEAAITIALAFIAGITEKMPEIVDSAFKLLIGFIDGLAEAIDNNHQKLFDAVGHLIKAIFNAIVDGVKTIVKGAQELLTGFFGEFDIGKIGKSLADIGSNLVQGIIDGITGFAGHLWDSAIGLGKQLIDGVAHALDENSPSKEGFKLGAFFDQGVANGVDDGANALYNKSANVAYGMLGAFGSALSDNSFSFDPNIDTSGLKNKLSNTSYKFIPNNLMDEMKKLDSYSLKELQSLRKSSTGLIQDYNNLTREQQISDEGKQLLEMIDYDQRLEEYTNARIDELVNQTSDGNSYNKKNLKQNTYNGSLLAENNKTSDEILVGVNSINGRLENTSTNNYAATSGGISNNGKESDSLMNELLSDKFNLIDINVRRDSVNQVKNDSIDELIWRKPYRNERDSLWYDYDMLSEADKNGLEGQRLLQMIDWNSLLGKFEDALINESYNNSSTSEVYTSGQLSNSITALGDDISNISPDITSAIGQSVNFNNDDLSSKISAQSDAITELGTTFNNGIDRLIGASDDIVTVLGQGTSVYMDTGTLVGELVPGIDKELGLRSALVGRGVR